MFGFGRKSVAGQGVRELKETASRHAKSGRWRQALPVLQALVEREPGEHQHRVRLGECLKRLGKTPEAQQQWLRAAKGWASDGVWDKATGACRLALAETPDDLNLRDLLNRLRERRQRTVQRTPRQPGARCEEPLEIEGWGDPTRRLEPPPPLLPIACNPMTGSD